MYITGLNNVKKIVLDMEGAAGVLKQIPLSKADGVPNFSFRVFTLEPGGHTPLHKHSFEHMNYVIEGRGVLVSEGKRNELKTGDFALVMPDELHQFRNISQEANLVLICAVPKAYE